MQQYIQNKCNEIDTRYFQKERALRDSKESDCYAITNAEAKQQVANVKRQKIALVVAEIITLVICVSVFTNGDYFVIIAGICILVFFLVKAMFKAIGKQLEADTRDRLNARESQLANEIQQLNAQKSMERKQFETETNNMMNQYRKTYTQSQTCIYLVEWLLSVMANEINKADRSQWLPQVKATLRFVVSYNNIEVPGFGKYDMAGQGIHIDNNPMAIGALAYVLEKSTLAEAQKRFTVDPNGGSTVFTSTRNDAHVEIIYSAPNGGAQFVR